MECAFEVLQLLMSPCSYILFVVVYVSFSTHSIVLFCVLIEYCFSIHSIVPPPRTFLLVSIYTLFMGEGAVCF